MTFAADFCRFGGESDDLSASLPNGKPAAGAKPAAKAADGKAKAAKAQKPTKAEAQQNSAPKVSSALLGS